MLFACIAVDGTAKLSFPDIAKHNKKRFTNFLRENYDVIVPMAFNGIDLVNSTFCYVDPHSTKEQFVDLAEFIYLVHRNTHAHGEELLPGYMLQADAKSGPRRTTLSFFGGATAISDRTIFALLACVVLAKVNANLRIGNADFDPFLTWEEQKFPIDHWWGRKADFVQIVKPIFHPGIALNFSALASRPAPHT
jgi:hypothetical protein